MIKILDMNERFCRTLYNYICCNSVINLGLQYLFQVNFLTNSVITKYLSNPGTMWQRYLIFQHSICRMAAISRIDLCRVDDTRWHKKSGGFCS